MTSQPSAANRAAAFFDLDKTLIARSSTLALVSTLVAEGMLRRRSVLRSAYAQAAYQLGPAGQSQSERLRVILGRIISGWDASRVASLARDRIAAKVAPQVFTEALELIGRHRAAGRDIVIVSASSRELVEPIASLLNADHTLATTMEVVDGHFTGQADFFNYGPAKVSAIQALAEVEGYDLTQSYAYSDSVTDLPMLEAVGHAAVVNPSPGLKRLAVERDWEVIHFDTPAAVKTENRRLAWLAVGLTVVPAVIITAAVWLTRRTVIHKQDKRP
ncbi:MAG: HAD-IB family hydrolase [Bifidobacteriaceae bacterium]|jgi:HAD superfamily hydrolase (TIGR01490 family)|nr:HAD-IB family hydrolase [Bifidobacteriaceae bacterium]